MLLGCVYRVANIGSTDPSTSYILVEFLHFPRTKLVGLAILSGCPIRIGNASSVFAYIKGLITFR